MSHAESLNNRMSRWLYQSVNGGSVKKRRKGLRKMKEIQKRMNELKNNA